MKQRVASRVRQNPPHSQLFHCPGLLELVQPGETRRPALKFRSQAVLRNRNRQTALSRLQGSGVVVQQVEALNRSEPPDPVDSLVAGEPRKHDNTRRHQHEKGLGQSPFSLCPEEAKSGQPNRKVEGHRFHQRRQPTQRTGHKARPASADQRRDHHCGQEQQRDQCGRRNGGGVQDRLRVNGHKPGRRKHNFSIEPPLQQNDKQRQTDAGEDTLHQADGRPPQPGGVKQSEKSRVTRRAKSVR